MEYTTGTNTKGATDETRHEATEEGPCGIAGDRGRGTDVGTLVRVIRSGKQALDAVMLEMGRKNRNVQRHLPTQYRKVAHHQLKTALEQTSDEDTRTMLLELEAWLRAKNESAADSLLEAFEELLTLHRLKVPARLRKTLMSATPIESMFSLVRHSERNITRTRGRTMLQRWLGTVLLYCEGRFNRVTGYAGIAQVIATIEAVQAEPQLVQTKKPA